MEYIFLNYEPEVLALSLLVQRRKMVWFSIWRHQLRASALVMYRNKCHVFLYCLCLTLNFPGHMDGKKGEALPARICFLGLYLGCPKYLNALQNKDVKATSAPKIPWSTPRVDSSPAREFPQGHLILSCQLLQRYRRPSKTLLKIRASPAPGLC